jgi:hypothetical protein
MDLLTDFFIKNAILSFGIIFACITVLNIILSPGSSEYNIQKYFALYAFPVLLIFGMILNLGREINATAVFLKVTAVLIIMSIGIYYYIYSTDSLFNISLLSNVSLLSLIIISGLAIAYSVISGFIGQTKGLSGFIIQLIFYIPCILLDLWEYIVSEFKLTPYSIYLFIIFEILLIILYAYLPNMTEIDGSIQALSNVMLLDSGKHIVVNSDQLKIQDNIDPNALQSNYLTNYAVSMWVFINPQSPTDPAYNKETEIFSYGYTDEDGIQHVKPMIRYYGGGGGSDQLVERNKFVFYLSRYPPITQYNSDEHTFCDVTLPNQKWNQIVLNYNRNNVDIFINGDLERSFILTNHMPVYNDLDTISVGDENGLKGGICNVVYYKHSLSKEQIATSYNIKMNSNPPISVQPIDSEI